MGRLSNRKGPVGRGSLLAVELAPRHSFYDRCNEILAEAEFDETVEMLCQPYYEDDGRLSIPPGRYFRMRLWCIKCDGDRPRPLCRFSGDFLGDWHAEAGHAVDHRAGDASLDLLCGQSPSPEAPAD